MSHHHLGVVWPFIGWLADDQSLLELSDLAWLAAHRNLYVRSADTADMVSLKEASV